MATDPGALFSQKDSEYSNAIGSSSRHASMEMRAAHVPLVAHGQLRLMLRPSQARQELQQDQAMLGFQRLRQLSALAPTIVIKPMDVAHMIHAVMPHRQYVASGWGHTEGCTPTTSIAGVSSRSGLLRTYVGTPEHGSGNSAMGYHLETLQRTAVTTELALGSSALVSDNAMPDWFDQDSTRKVHVDAGSGGASMKKSYSMDCLRLAAPSSLVSSSSSLLLSIGEGLERASNGYLSDGPHGRVVQERKKGVPWNEEEHRLFLVGLEKLGKGDWRGISRSYVKTRTPTQVASHAQKFFLRQSRMGKKKRRSSLFDMVPICENGVRVSEPLSSGQGASTSLSLNMLRHESSERAAIDLNSTEEDDKVDVSSASGASARPFPMVLMEQPSHGHHCSPLDLELGMSLSTPSIGT